MLRVKTPDEVAALMDAAFTALPEKEAVPLESALGRTLAAPVTSAEYIPGFHRSTVDGYAVRAADSFGCSEAIPAIFALQGQIAMGEAAASPLQAGACFYVPTGGAIPEGADAVVMIEHTEDYRDGTVGIIKPAAPGENLIYKGDDVCPGQEVFPAGHRLSAKDIGALAAMGAAYVEVCRKPRVGILSTGDELIPVEAVPQGGQIRDLNTSMLAALVTQAGGEAVCYGIIRDEKAILSSAMQRAVEECDMVLVSGGSSVGLKDATAEVIAAHGEVLFHGIAMKPGKPTILGRMRGKPVWGLPGHPVAAFFVAHIFVRPLLAKLMGCTVKNYTIPARLTEPVSANHGRAQYSGVKLTLCEGEWLAQPIRGKSGLITTLAAADGYFCIPRDREGAAAGETIRVTLFQLD